jgi:hypothetical protein
MIRLAETRAHRRAEAALAGYRDTPTLLPDTHRLAHHLEHALAENRRLREQLLAMAEERNQLERTGREVRETIVLTLGRLG